MADIENKFKVKLVNPNGVGLSSRREVVAFDVSPDIIETRNVNYKSLEPIHMPGTVQVYNNSSSRSYNISNIKIISRTQEEATKNLYKLNLLRAWTVPVFGQSTISSAQQNNRNTLYKTDTQGKIISGDDLRREARDANKSIGTELLGAPPPILQLSAYSDPNDQKNTHGNINRVPVVISQMSIPYPSDVDYIPTMDGKELASNNGSQGQYKYIHAGIPVPTLMVIDITCMETHSPSEYSKFNLKDFKRGQLKGF